MTQSFAPSRSRDHSQPIASTTELRYQRCPALRLPKTSSTLVRAGTQGGRGALEMVPWHGSWLPRHDGRLCYCDWPCLTVTNTFAPLRLLPWSDRDKDVEILALRHQITVLQRPLDKERVRFTAGDRAFLAACRTGFRRRGCVGCGCWCGRTRCCAGTGTWSPAATLPHPGRSAREGRGPYTPSAPWTSASPGRIPTGATAASTANSSSSGSGWPRPPSGRCSRTPASTRCPSGPPAPGPTSCTPKPTPSWPATSWKQSHCPGHGCMSSR